ncbi:MAG TPA: hypothetical protein PKC30_02645 [Saprospiraceae bacterium]|nr:hypothetical protein [Saprospiraceae bacterium]
MSTIVSVIVRTLLNIGFLDLPGENPNAIKNILNDKQNRRMTMFEQQNEQLVEYAKKCRQQLIQEKKVDDSYQAYEKKRRMVDAYKIKHKDARELEVE